jgi:5-methylcytosine-specific restriction endonuclease McrA
VKRPCIEIGCPGLTTGTRCAEHERQRQQAKWSRNPNRDPEYRKVRQAYADRLPFPCALCGDFIRVIGHGPESLTLDHIRPWSVGGTNDPGNLRPAHKRCNSARGAGA